MKKTSSLHQFVLPIALSIAAVGGSFLPLAASGADAGCKSCLKTASGLFSKGDNAGAAKVLSEWQSKCPDNLQILLMLNTVLMRTRDGKQQALEAAEKACKLAPSNMLPHFQKAMTLMMMQQGAAAAREFKTVVDIDPTSYEAWSALGELLGAEGDSAGAKAASEKAIALSPSAKAAQIAAITSKNRTGNMAAVKQEIDKAGQGEAETLLTVGTEAFKLGYLESAQKLLTRARAKYPQAAPVRELLPLAETFASTANKDPFQSLAAQKNKLAPGATSSLSQGLHNLDQGQSNEAIEQFGDAYARDKNLTLARLFTAQAHLSKGDYKAAIGEAKETASLASGLKPACMAVELTARLRDGEDTGTAINGLKVAIQADMAHADSFNQAFAEAALGELSINEKDLSGASSHFQSAQKHWLNFVPAQCGLAQVAITEGKQDTALTELDKALATAPGDKRALSLKGLALILSGKADEGQKLLELVSASDSVLPAKLHTDIASALQKGGHNKEAAAHYKKALEVGASGALMQQVKDGLKACQ